MSTTNPTGEASSNPPAQKSYSCVLCAQRKVKCDKHPRGCSNCSKARVPCIYKAPPPPRRRKKGEREIDTTARLRLYENALRKLGVDPLTLEEETGPTTEPPGTLCGGLVRNPLVPPSTFYGPNNSHGVATGMLIQNGGKSRYLNNSMWTSIKEEFRDSTELFEESSDEEELNVSQGSTPATLSSDAASILLTSPGSATSLRYFHPEPVQILRLWQKYLDNVNPLVKLFHAPTVQEILYNAISNLDDIPKNVECLMFSLYAVTLVSLDDAECIAIMGEPKAVVSRRFQTAAQLALINASFLRTSEMMVLQAYLLWIVSLQSSDPRTEWILTGIAGRIGQQLGLHKDPASLGLPPFEVQIKRRIWWQIIFLDGFAEKLAGAAGSVTIGETELPANVNDSDLFPGMKEAPREKEGATEMTFFLLRCQAGQMLNLKHVPGTFNGVWAQLGSTTTTIDVKYNAIDLLEARMQDKFLRYCDTSVPWHFMCHFLAKCIVAILRFTAHSPESYPNFGAGMPQADKDMLFDVCLRVTRYQNSVFQKDDLRGFRWHLNVHFQWKALIYLISELRYRTSGPDTQEAWKQVQLVYEFHPTLAKDTNKRALPTAIGSLTLKAWDAYIHAQSIPQQDEPHFIHVLRSHQRKCQPASLTSAPEQPTQVAAFERPNDMPLDLSIQPSDPLQSFQWSDDLAASLDSTIDLPDLKPLDLEQMNWATWNNLVFDFQSQGVQSEFFTGVPAFDPGTR